MAYDPFDLRRIGRKIGLAVTIEDGTYTVKTLRGVLLVKTRERRKAIQALDRWHLSREYRDLALKRLVRT